MNYDIDYFIKHFEPIKEEKWCIGDIDNGQGQYCTMGHLGAIHGRYKNEKVLALSRLLRSHFPDHPADIIFSASDIWDTIVPYINDIEHEGTPKSRILDYLYQIKDAENAVSLVNEIIKNRETNSQLLLTH